MGSICNHNNANCSHYVPDYDIGFKIVTPKQGDVYEGHKYDNHSLVFLLEGETEFSYNDFLNRRFKQGDLFFIPQASEMHGVAVTDAKMLILTFNNRVESLCDRCRATKYANDIANIVYDFRPLKITETLYMFVHQMEVYIQKNIKCSYLNELKQKELFVVLGAEYSEVELVELFYPVSGGSIDFKSRIMENYSYGLGVNELAQKFGMSYSPFLRKFKKEFGMPAQEWMLKQKAKHIKLRLSIPSTKISDIVREFDFTDLPHFIRFCRKQYGCTPNELRESVNRSKIEQYE